MNKTDLSKYNNDTYKLGAGFFKQTLWYFVNALIFKSSYFPFYNFKSFLLKCFGAKVGKNIKIKPSVNIKYPWKLTIGNNSWIGEYVWIDNLDDVFIGANVCLSQGSMLLTGNHNYKSTTFDLITKPIHLEDGVWIGAKSLVTPGVTCKTHSVLTAFSVASKDLEPYTIYSGNPAKKKRVRTINS